MTISCHLRILLARVNVERAKQSKPTISLRCLAEECGVSLSVLASLHKGKSRRVDYATFDRLLTYFNSYFTVTINDLLVWEPSQLSTRTVHAAKREPLVEGARVYPV